MVIEEIASDHSDVVDTLSGRTDVSISCGDDIVTPWNCLSAGNSLLPRTCPRAIFTMVGCQFTTSNCNVKDLTVRLSCDIWEIGTIDVNTTLKFYHSCWRVCCSCGGGTRDCRQPPTHYRGASHMVTQTFPCSSTSSTASWLCSECVVPDSQSLKLPLKDSALSGHTVCHWYCYSPGVHGRWQYLLCCFQFWGSSLVVRGRRGKGGREELLYKHTPTSLYVLCSGIWRQQVKQLKW